MAFYGAQYGQYPQSSFATTQQSAVNYSHYTTLSQSSAHLNSATTSVYGYAANSSGATNHNSLQTYPNQANSYQMSNSTNAATTQAPNTLPSFQDLWPSQQQAANASTMTAQGANLHMQQKQPTQYTAQNIAAYQAQASRFYSQMGINFTPHQQVVQQGSNNAAMFKTAMSKSQVRSVTPSATQHQPNDWGNPIFIATPNPQQQQQRDTFNPAYQPPVQPAGQQSPSKNNRSNHVPAGTGAWNGAAFNTQSAPPNMLKDWVVTNTPNNTVNYPTPGSHTTNYYGNAGGDFNWTMQPPPPTTTMPPPTHVFNHQTQPPPPRVPGYHQQQPHFHTFSPTVPAGRSGSGQVEAPRGPFDPKQLQAHPAAVAPTALPPAQWTPSNLPQTHWNNGAPPPPWAREDGGAAWGDYTQGGVGRRSEPGAGGSFIPPFPEAWHVNGAAAVRPQAPEGGWGDQFVTSWNNMNNWLSEVDTERGNPRGAGTATQPRYGGGARTEQAGGGNRNRYSPNSRQSRGERSDRELWSPAESKKQLATTTTKTPTTQQRSNSLPASKPTEVAPTPPAAAAEADKPPAEEPAPPVAAVDGDKQQQQQVVAGGVEIKSFLYSWLGVRHRKPIYETQTLTDRPTQAFRCELKVGGYKFVSNGEAGSKKEAQTEAAWQFADHLVRLGELKKQNLPPRVQYQCPRCLDANEAANKKTPEELDFDAEKRQTNNNNRKPRIHRSQQQQQLQQTNNNQQKTGGGAGKIPSLLSIVLPPPRNVPTIPPPYMFDPALTEPWGGAMPFPPPPHWRPPRPAWLEPPQLFPVPPPPAPFRGGDRRPVSEAGTGGAWQPGPHPGTVDEMWRPQMIGEEWLDDMQDGDVMHPEDIFISRMIMNQQEATARAGAAAAMCGAGPPARMLAPPMAPPDAKQRTAATLDDRHVMTKHSLIYPSEEELRSVHEMVTLIERALKALSDQFVDEDHPLAKDEDNEDSQKNGTAAEKSDGGSTPDAGAGEPGAAVERAEEQKMTTVGDDGDGRKAEQKDDDVVKNGGGESVKQERKIQILKRPKVATAPKRVPDTRPRALCGVNRVGALAKGLLVRGDTRVGLVLLCGEVPTDRLLRRILLHLPDKIKEANEVLEYEVQVDEAGFTVSAQFAVAVTLTVTLTSTLLKPKPSSGETPDPSVDTPSPRESSEAVAMTTSNDDDAAAVQSKTDGTEAGEKSAEDTTNDEATNDEVTSGATNGVKGEDPTTTSTTKAEEEPTGMLPKSCLLHALAQLRHAKWFQARASQQESGVVMTRIMRDLQLREPAWAALSCWALENLVYVALSSSTENMSPGDAFRRFFEVVSGGVLLPDRPGIQDPCEREATDVLDCCNEQQLEDITRHAQHALLQITFRGIHQVLGMEKLLPNQTRFPPVNNNPFMGLPPHPYHLVDPHHDVMHHMHVDHDVMMPPPHHHHHDMMAAAAPYDVIMSSHHHPHHHHHRPDMMTSPRHHHHHHHDTMTSSAHQRKRRFDANHAATTSVTSCNNHDVNMMTSAPESCVESPKRPLNDEEEAEAHRTLASLTLSDQPPVSDDVTPHNADERDVMPPTTNGAGRGKKKSPAARSDDTDDVSSDSSSDGVVVVVAPASGGDAVAPTASNGADRRIDDDDDSTPNGEQ